MFREGGFNGEIQIMEPNGVALDAKANANWGDAVLVAVAPRRTTDAFRPALA